MTSKPRHLSLCLALVILLLAAVHASSMVYGKPVKATVSKATLKDKKKNNWTLQAKLLEHPNVAQSGFYSAAQYKKGSVVTFEVDRSQRAFKPGDAIKVRWGSYSAMGANGPVGGLSWEYVK